jgi:hypothetical protein
MSSPDTGSLTDWAAEATARVAEERARIAGGPIV